MKRRATVMASLREGGGAHKEKRHPVKRSSRAALKATHSAKRVGHKRHKAATNSSTSVCSTSDSTALAATTSTWAATADARQWRLQPTKSREGVDSGNASASPSPAAAAQDRYDINGTSTVNELVLRHGTMPTSDLKASSMPRLFRKTKTPQRAAPHSDRETCFALERYLSNLVRALVHPLHNFLQCHHGLHNADEVQVMLMPRDGPIAAADRRRGSKAAPSSPAGTSAATRRCYVATNNETLTEEGLRRATANWGVAGVFQISSFALVSGEKGRHAEQKLLDHLWTNIVAAAGSTLTGEVSAADQKAIVVGERLPCAACRLYAIPYEGAAVLLPSHGHMYLSTIPPSLQALEAAQALSEPEKELVRAAYRDPSAAARLLLSPQHQRVLR